MERIVFLDRDGTINKEVNYLHRQSDLHILPGVPQALALLKEAGFRLVVVTNQAGVARGYYTEEDVKHLHAYMNSLLEQSGAAIDWFYYCPHHPVYGMGVYKKDCSCRKPKTGMFQMAEKAFSTDKAHSYMVGDKLVDIEAGRNYGLTSILVGTGYGREIHEQDEKTGTSRLYHHYADTLLEAAQWIVKKGQAENHERDAVSSGVDQAVSGFGRG